MVKEGVFPFRDRKGPRWFEKCLQRCDPLLSFLVNNSHTLYGMLSFFTQLELLPLKSLSREKNVTVSQSLLTDPADPPDFSY